MSDETCRKAERRSSSHLFEMLSDTTRSAADRFSIISSLTALDYGVWQSRGSTRPETLRGFASRLMTTMVEEAARAGVPRATLDVDRLVSVLLAEFFRRWPSCRMAVRRWLVREAVKLVRVQAYLRARIWLVLDVARVAPTRRRARGRHTNVGSTRLRRRVGQSMTRRRNPGPK